MKRLLQLTIVLLITTGLTTVASAQSANITASASIQSSVSVSSVTGGDLNFGTVPSGQATPVAYDAADAGEFEVSGNETVTLSFTLPSQLTNLSGSGSTMPINFVDGDAAWSDDGTTYNEFNPNGSTDVNLWDSNDSSDGTVSVFIGGEVNPASNQEAGTYQGTITLEATYN